MTLIVSPILFGVIFALILYVFVNLIRKCKSGVEVSYSKVNVQNKSPITQAKKDEIVIKSKNSTDSSDNEYVIYPQPPGPRPWPILGNLNTLGEYESPFIAFSAMGRKYGDIFSLMLGSTRGVVVGNLEIIKEILNENGKYFGGRPDFIRYRRIFGGDRSNSLALCDWSLLQQKRRNLARKHCSPRDGSDFFEKMNKIGCTEMKESMEMMKRLVKPEGTEMYLKPLIQRMSANLFTRYMSSTKFEYDDAEFIDIVNSFDEVFWEINQGYALDFLPWLKPFYHSHLKGLDVLSKKIRAFIMNRIIIPRYELMKTGADVPEDFLATLLGVLETEQNVTENTIIYMMEDFIGGHSAIGNLVYIALGYIVKKPEIGLKIQEEIDRTSDNGSRCLNLNDIEHNMPYTMAFIFEILRHSSSPIVPHVATENTCIAGYGIAKDTVIFINNHELNTNEKYWEKPKEFIPERFLETIPAHKIDKNATMDAPDITRIKKNIPHFLPFSIGKRTCIGQNLVRCYSFLLITNILQNFNLTAVKSEEVKFYPSCLALPPQTFSILLTPR